MRCAVEGEPDPQGPIKEQCLGNSNHIKATTEQRQKPPPRQIMDLHYQQRDKLCA